MQQPMDDAKITLIRHDPIQADAMLRDYIWEGRYGGVRVPRGISPAQVSMFLKLRMTPTTGPTAMGRVLEVMRFYERRDVIEHFVELYLKRRPVDRAEIRRALLVTHIVGEIGEEKDALHAVAFIEEHIAPHLLLADEYPMLCSAFTALAPFGDMSKCEKRLSADIAAAEPESEVSEEGLRVHTELVMTQGNDVPRAHKLRKAKSRLLSAKPGDRRTELVNIYMNASPLSTSVMEVWAARLLRQEAFTPDPDGPTPVPLEPYSTALPAIAEFERHMKKNGPAGEGEPVEPFAFAKAYQAFVYLGGKPTDATREAYLSMKERTPNFLWDDPFEPPRPGEGLTNEDDE